MNIYQIQAERSCKPAPLLHENEESNISTNSLQPCTNMLQAAVMYYTQQCNMYMENISQIGYQVGNKKFITELPYKFHHKKLNKQCNFQYIKNKIDLDTIIIPSAISNPTGTFPLFQRDAFKHELQASMNCNQHADDSPFINIDRFPVI